MTETAVLLHQEPEHVIEGPPRGQLPKGYEMLFHSLESVIRDADQADALACLNVELNTGFHWRHFRLRAWPIGAVMHYEVKNQFGVIIEGKMDRVEA